MSDSMRMPVNGNILVRLENADKTERSTEGGVFLPDTADNTEDCVGEVLAVSERPGFELPQWAAEKIASRNQAYFCPGSPENEVFTPFTRLEAEKLQELCATRRPPDYSVGQRVLFDITLATLAPGSDNDDEFFVPHDAVYAVLEGSERVELIKTQADGGGFKTK